MFATPHRQKGACLERGSLAPGERRELAPPPRTVRRPFTRAPDGLSSLAALVRGLHTARRSNTWRSHTNSAGWGQNNPAGTGASALGAQHSGESGPYGVRPAEDDDGPDDQPDDHTDH